jgi:hypothetical protein
MRSEGHVARMEPSHGSRSASSNAHSLGYEFKYYPERAEGVFWKWVPAMRLRPMIYILGRDLWVSLAWSRIAATPAHRRGHIFRSETRRS